MKLVVGLGNPGRRYEDTRHNTGFAVLAELARRHGSGRPKSAFRGMVVDVDMSGVRALLLCPETYMNRSGMSVRLALDFYKLERENLLVVCDDLNLPLGKLRMRTTGSAGGHNGLEDVSNQLGSQDYARLRVGIGAPPHESDATGFVLTRFRKDEREVIEEAIARAADCVAIWACEGIETCMNRYN